MQFQQSDMDHPKSFFIKGWIGRSTVALALMTTLLAACQTTERQASAPDQGNVSTEEVAENTNQYIGQTVTVRSEPIQKMSPSTFTIEDEQFFGSQPILVVNATGKPFTFPDNGTDIQVTGEVRNFVFSDVEREYNLGLDVNVYRDYENKPAIIAQSIALAPKPGDITQNPQPYYGKTLAVTGEVEDIKNQSAFTLDEDKLLGAQDLLVVYAQPKAGNQPNTSNQAAAQTPTITDGEKVAVTGVLRPFVLADFERDYDLTWDLNIQRQLEAEYKNKPVLVATGVYPSAIPDSAQ